MKFAINRSWLILGTALVIGGLAAFGVNRYIQRQVEDIEARSRATKTVRVVVPKEDIPKGTAIEARLVAVREVPAEWGHSNAVTPEQFDRIEKQVLAYAAARGEMLLWSMFEGQRAPTFSSRLASGRRAITVPVDEVNSISGMVEPGDRIDLVVTARRENKVFMFPLLQNVPVLATGTRAATDGSDKDGKQRTFTTITLDASPEDAQKVLAAREIGKVAALLRAPGDSVRTPSDRREAMALLGIGPDVRTDSSVPVLYGGGNANGLSAIAPLRAAAQAIQAQAEEARPPRAPDATAPRSPAAPTERPAPNAAAVPDTKK